MIIITAVSSALVRSLGGILYGYSKRHLSHPVIDPKKVISENEISDDRPGGAAAAAATTATEMTRGACPADVYSLAYHPCILVGESLVPRPVPSEKPKGSPVSEGAAAALPPFIVASGGAECVAFSPLWTFQKQAVEEERRGMTPSDRSIAAQVRGPRNS